MENKTTSTESHEEPITTPRPIEREPEGPSERDIDDAHYDMKDVPSWYDHG